MTRTESPRPGGVDLTSCDREPIHIPGSIQPHGLLLVLDGPEFVVRRASENAPGLLGKPLAEVIGRPLADVFGRDQADRLRLGAGGAPAGQPAVVGEVRIGRGESGPLFHALAHRSGGFIVLELEPADADAVGAFHEVYQPLQSFLSRLDSATSSEALLGIAASEVRRVTGFDRVLIYRFDEDGHGTVVAQDGTGRLPSLLGHRFPGSDIPRQARELYRLNRFRLIPDAGYTPVPIVPEAAEPLDMSFSTLRSISPVHVEYMRNMGTAASLSISILLDGTLWGLIACHHKEPRMVPFGVRAGCDFLARLLAVQLANTERQRTIEHRLRLGSIQSRLIAGLTARGDVAEGLANQADDLLSFAAADGAAILFEGRCLLIGATPTEGEVRGLATWLSEDVRREVFATDELGSELPWGLADPGRTSGLLAVSISKLYNNYLMWFRPEMPRTVVWAGDPRTSVSPEGGGETTPTRLHPRASFEAWKEVLRGRSAGWESAEIEAAVEFRNAIVGVVLRTAEELAQLNTELTRSNQELEAFSYSVSHDLRAPFRHIVGYAELLRDGGIDRIGPQAARYVETIIESATYAGTLVDNLLAFSRMGRTTIHPVEVDMNTLVRESIVEASRDAEGRNVVWKVGDLPAARGDLMMLRLAVGNLLSNALKYTRPRAEAVIEIGGEERAGETVYFVRDNGIGFDMRYVDKLFGVFQRLHRMEDFEGTGIGLANVRRIVARHGGRAWGEGVEGVGATFFIALPKGGTS